MMNIFSFKIQPGIAPLFFPYGSFGSGRSAFPDVSGDRLNIRQIHHTILISITGPHTIGTISPERKRGWKKSYIMLAFKDSVLGLIGKFDFSFVLSLESTTSGIHQGVSLRIDG